MADPTELERLLFGIAPRAGEVPAAGSRALGSTALLEKGLPQPGVPGPQTPGISSRYQTFAPPAMIPQPPTEYQGVVGDPQGANSALSGLTDEVSATYRNLMSPQEQDRMAKWMQMIYATPPQGDPIQWPNYAENAKEKLSAARDLAGAPHELMMALTQEDHTQLFMAPNETPEITRLKFGEARWASGVVQEAQRVGLKLDEELMLLPPEMPPSMRIAALAQKVVELDPNAAVGPPDSVLQVPPVLRAQPQVREVTPPKNLPLLDTADIRSNIRRVAPSPEAFQSDPQTAAVQTQQILSTLAAAQPFHAGDFVPKLPDNHPLALTVPAVVPIHVDEDGRLMATIPQGDEGNTQVEVTHGLGAAAIPAMVDGEPVKWDFIPNRTAPARLMLDPKSEQLVIDPDETERLGPLQDAWARSVKDSESIGVVNPMEDPVQFLDAIATVALPSSVEANNAVANSDELLRQHNLKGIDIINTAKTLVGPDASPREVARETARIIREYHFMGSVVEAARAIALQRRDEIMVREAQDSADLFGPSVAYSRKKKQTVTPALRKHFYAGKSEFAGPWGSLRRLHNLSTPLVADILKHPEPLDWKDASNEEAVLDRIVTLGVAEVKAQLKSGASGKDWYRRDIKTMFRNVKALFPDMTPEERTLFTMVLAITSNGHTPSKNFALAAWAQEQYHLGGSYPSSGPHTQDSWGGIKSATIGNHMARLQGLIDFFEGDLKAIDKFLKAEMMIGNRSDPDFVSLRYIERALRSEGKWTRDTSTELDESTINLGTEDELVRGAMIFGPKLGAFFCNMNGISNVLTIDAWKSRSFHRWMGSAPSKTDRDGKLVSDDSVSLAQRRLLQKGYEGIVKKLRRSMGEDFDVMDAQAILWYYEKRLFAHAGAKPSGMESFADASRKYVDAYSQRSFPENFLLGRGVGTTLREREEPYDPGANRPDISSGERRHVTFDEWGRRMTEESQRRRRFSDKIDALENLPYDEKEIFRARIRIETSQDARQVILDEAIAADKGWSKMSWMREAATPLRPGPNPEVIRLARAYMQNVPWPYDEAPWEVGRQADAKLGAKCAFVHDQMPHIPFDSDVQEAYNAMKEETLAQYLFLEGMGFKMEPWLREGQPYANSAEMQRDVLENRHLFFFQGGDLMPGHPLAEHIPESEGHAVKRMFHLAQQATSGALLSDDEISRRIKPLKGINKEYLHTQIRISPTREEQEFKIQEAFESGGQTQDELIAPLEEALTLTYNDIFRAVHDIFGHAKQGNQFGPRGEVIAYGEHSRMYSPLARKAMATETFMQNSWVNFGPQAEGLAPPDRPYAEQKAYIVPEDLLTEIRQTYSSFYPRTEPVNALALPKPLEQLAAEVVAAVQANGGATFHLTRPDMQPLNANIGFGVASDPREKRYRTVPLSLFSPLHVIEMVTSNLDVLGDNNIFIGSWVDKEGLVWLEPSETVMDKDLAISLGKRRNQIAIWDAANGCEIDVGGTGHERGSIVKEQGELPEMREQNFQVKQQLAALGPVRGPKLDYVVGLGINTDAIVFDEDGKVDLSGVRVKSPLDVARALMPLRNPTFETLRLLFVDMDEGTILTQIALSSKKANTVSYGYDESIGASKQTLQRLRQETGHDVKLIHIHNHPSGVVTPSKDDLDGIEYFKKELGKEGDLAYAMVINHDSYTTLFRGENGWHYETSPIPENVGQDDPILQTTIPHPQIGKKVRTSQDIRTALQGPEDVMQDAGLENHVTVAYRNVAGLIRMVEHIPVEKMRDIRATKEWIKAQAQAVGAYDAYAYHPDPSWHFSEGELANLVVNNVVKDFIYGASESALASLNDSQHYIRKNVLERDAIVPDAIRVAESVPDADEQAQLRARALAYSAAGKSWSGKEGRKLFAALTPPEKLQAMIARIQDGNITSDRHLDALDPSTWGPEKYPGYFGNWRPSPHEMTTLQAAWDERANTWKAAKRVQEQIEQNVARRALTFRTKRTTSTKPIKLEDLLTIQTSTLDRWAKDEPAKYDEWVRQFYKIADPATEEIAKDPDVQKRQRGLGKIDVLRAAIAEIEEGKVSQGPHPNGDPDEPYNGIQVAMLNARGAVRGMTSVLRMMGRPYTVLGNARQGDHPLDIQNDMDSGKFQRSIFQDLWQGHLKVNQEVLKAFSEFEPLARAASVSEDLDRKIHRAMDTGVWRSPEQLDRPEWQVAPVKVGLKKQEIKLSEWLPKLAKFYEKMIGDAEKSIIYRLNTESVKYRADIAWLESEIRRREVSEALRMGWVGAPRWTGVAWEDSTQEWSDIHPDTLKLVQEKLRKENKATDDHSISYVGGLPRFLGLDPYRTLVARYKAAETQLKRRLETKDAIQNDHAMRRENYITYVHRASVDRIRAELSDPYSTFGRYVSPKVRNHFLDPRKSDTEPYQSWLAGWFMYVPTMMKTAHLEPGLIKASKRMRSLPVDQQEYANHWIRHLKGTDVPWDKLMNRVVFEGTMHEQGELDGLIKTLTRGAVDLPAMTKGAQEAGQLDNRPWNKALRGFAGWTYFGLIGPWKVGKMNLTEFAFLTHELAKRPVPDLPLGAAWAAMGFARAGAESGREFASWIKNMATAAPRWYSEASYMGVTESANAILEEIRQHGETTEAKMLARAGKSAPFIWASFMRAGEYWLRATTYYTLKNRGKWYGLDEELNQITAAQQTNHSIGAYSKRDLSPVARGAFWQPWWMFKRFPWAKTELFAQEVRGTLEAAGQPIQQGKYLAQSVGNMMGVGSRPTPMSMGSFQDAELEGDDSMPPILPPPPRNPGGAYDEWPEDEQQVWEDVNTPAAEYGSAFPAGVRGSGRLLMQLAFGAPLTLAGLYEIASLVGLNEDTDSPWNNINPIDISNLADITALFWVKDTYRYMMLGAKGTLYGLTAKEAKEKDFRAERILYFLPMLGRALRNSKFRQNENKEFQKSFLRKMGFSLDKMGRFGMPKMPHGSKRTAGPITQPGLLLKLWNAVKGKPSLPETPEAQPEPEPAAAQ